MEKATFGAGCFWGVELTFSRLSGVLETAVGYCGGQTENPTYEEVCRDTTGYAEVVDIQFDPQVVSYEELLKVFFNSHNPTTLNRQGPDVGSQYRSAIFYHSEEQKELAEYFRDQLQTSGKYESDIVTTIESIKPFYRAEEYHQKYLEKRGQTSCQI